MFLIEIFLPTYDNDGQRFTSEAFHAVRNELAEKFGGVTAFLRSPATGLWADENGELRRDELAIFEVMTDQVDRAWWQNYRHDLEQRFRQEEILVRVTGCEQL